MVEFEKPQSRAQMLKDDPLGKYHVWWMDVRKTDAKRLTAVLETARRERELQAYFELQPMALIQHLAGGHGRYVIPQKRLGSEHVTDFMIGHCHSGGFEWQAVEIESPTKKMFTKTGDPTKELNHAIRQILDWRAWLKRNQNYAANPLDQGGLGLTDVDCNLPGLILIGRRATTDPKTHDRRRQMVTQLNVQIHTYDFLIDNCVAAAAFWNTVRRRSRGA
ncbi:MAG: DUF4263 domain-containing protein [Planctomycetaceae bacterium]|nr:DUF4263 domain-containing protein [Planctomycetaceae bacterium]